VVYGATPRAGQLGETVPRGHGSLTAPSDGLTDGPLTDASRGAYGCEASLACVLLLLLLLLLLLVLLASLWAHLGSDWPRESVLRKQNKIR
jgi:hypothetical protein